MDQQTGINPLPKSYWEENYSEPETIDGICNAKEHALYLKSFFDIEGIEIRSIIDFGFGLGYLFKEMLKEFTPTKAYGIEPSPYAFEGNTLNKVSKKLPNLNLKLKQTDIYNFCLKEMTHKPRLHRYDLGLITSVFQYLKKEEIEASLPIIAKSVKYLYFSVPIDKEYERQVEELDFNDQYAFRRSQGFYKRLLSPYFTVVSARVLESRHFFSQENTELTDLFFRF